MSDQVIETVEISQELQAVLQQIVEDVVQQLDCIGAIAGILEQGNALHVRATSFNLSPQKIQHCIEKHQLPFLESEVVYLDKAKHQHNLGVHAIKNANSHVRPYQISNRLYDLLRPMTSKQIADQVQEELCIQQVIAIPFLLNGEVAGNLIAAKVAHFTERDIDILLAFGRQAAATIQSGHRLQAMGALERVILKLQARMTDENEVLQTIVDAVVHELGYKGAMVATLEQGNALPVRAYALKAAAKILSRLEKQAGISLIGPKAVVYLDDEKYKDNLSVRAVKGENGRPQKFITSDSLYDLLRPIADKTLAGLAQRLLKIKQVIAVPFYLEDEVVGNLFVASSKPNFSDWEVSLLTAFGQQAAAGIRNARLYREAEQQQKIAQMFGRMAFSATASVHALGNHMSAIYTFVQMLTTFSGFSLEQRDRIMAGSPAILERLDRANRLLDNLHEPWHQVIDRPVSVNDCLNHALREVFPEIIQEFQNDTVMTDEGITIHLQLEYDLPLVSTSADMLTEAFRVLIKNGAEAIRDKGTERHLWLVSQKTAPNQIEITVKDSGVGIKPEHLPHIFDMGWSTKGSKGMGFGLFWTQYYLEGMNGRISAESTRGKGTTFHIQLPTDI